LDGETDWKLREPVKMTQKLISEGQNILQCPGLVQADKPIVNIYEFLGVFYSDYQGQSTRESLRLNNTMWADTVLATGEAHGLVIYTGKECRRTMNSKNPKEKIGQCDQEINVQGKVLFLAMVLISIFTQFLSGFDSNFNWVISMFRYFILLCNIIPISLRVNMDLAKIVYSWRITNDKEIEGTVARNSNIPEELGRIQYL
jgi:phospholipid-translocating ATPase